MIEVTYLNKIMERTEEEDLDQRVFIGLLYSFPFLKKKPNIYRAHTYVVGTVLHIGSYNSDPNGQ